MAIATATPSLTVDLEVKLIRVPEDRRRSFDKIDEKNQLFVDSIQRIGVLQPIDLRMIDDRYQLVFGRRRLWAAKQLGLPTIPCRISSWSDAQVAWVAIAENHFRGHLTPVQYAKQMQLLFRKFERCFGPDPGKAAGAMARARSAHREPETKRFNLEPLIDARPPEIPGECPALTAAVAAGPETAPTPPIPSRAPTVPWWLRPPASIRARRARTSRSRPRSPPTSSRRSKPAIGLPPRRICSSSPGSPTGRSAIDA